MSDESAKLLTVVVNPTKLDDLDHFRAVVEQAVQARSKAAGTPMQVRWAETTVDDSGAGQARRAVDQGASLVVAAGGDGTVTACAAALAETNVVLGIIPIGTGNLLARNLGIPLARRRAIEVALGDHVRRIDVLASGDQRFVVMAGMGLDAVMIRETDDDLKDKLGWLGYLEGVRRAVVGAKRATYTVTIDNAATPIRQKAVDIVVANVGELTAGVTLMSQAVPDDGRFDVLILAPPPRITHWITVIARVILRRLPEDPTIHLTQASTVTIRSDIAMPVEYDGEPADRTTELTITILPSSLTVRCPPHEQGLLDRLVQHRGATQVTLDRREELA